MRGLSFLQRLPADAPLRQIETPALEQSTRSSSNASEHCHSSRDWMPRDDDIDFSQPWNGEVVLSPVKFRLGPGEKNDAAKLFERAHNHKYFARVRNQLLLEIPGCWQISASERPCTAAEVAPPDRVDWPAYF